MYSPWRLGVIFTYGFISPHCQVTQSKICLKLSRQNENTHNDNERTIPLVMAKQVILPGEKKTIWVDDTCLIEETIRDNFGVLATGLCIGEEDLMEMASLCEIREFNVKEDGATGTRNGYFVNIECVGRVKLNALDLHHPYPRFHFSLVKEEEENLEDCKMVAENIEIFMTILSDDKDEQDADDNNNVNLLSRYKSTCERNFRIQHSPRFHSQLMQSLSATSWAAFTVMDNMNNLEHYRLRALDYDNVFDRLKLAQYMLREKELRLQGIRMQSKSLNTETPGGFE
mmetsp:Transcript_1929/g.2283  ORF Transcript_1929/g.2283 Transcript_1929/m.2283 type:complete len:285 (+) Transcript_1929:84-938(+)